MNRETMKLLKIFDLDEEADYTARGETSEPHRYRFRSERGTGRSPYAAHDSRYRTIRPAVTLTSSIRESAKFPY